MSAKKAMESGAGPPGQGSGDKKTERVAAVIREDVIEVDEQWDLRTWNEYTAESKIRALRTRVDAKAAAPPPISTVSGAKVVVVARNGRNYLSLEKNYGNINREDIIHLKREADRKNWQCVLDGDLRGADLRGLDLTAMNFSGADLREAIFIHAVCHHTNFSQADLSGADLTSGDFLEADFRETNLYGVLATCAVFSYADFRKARLTYADLRLSDLHGASLLKAKLFGTKLGGATLQKTKMTLFGLLVNSLSKVITLLFPPPTAG
ncbi:MAG: pentapeptide repeat-containing protein [Phycisphaerae bacterium]